MLPTKLLKLRLARIEKGEGYLSTQDKLMLVSMESPDLSANFFLRLFKVSLPKQWKFQHETDEDILYKSHLIKLIENQFIPRYESHARKHAWYEQCLVYQLNCIVPQPTQPQTNLYLRQLDKCLDQQPKIDLLLYFQQQYPSAKHAVALAKAYAGAEQYTEAIKQHEWASQQSIQRSEIVFYVYIACLVNRNQSEYMPNVSDVEYAIDLLSKFEKPVDQKTYLNILKSAVNALLPAVILQTQAIETNQFEAEQRAQALFDWMQQKLEKGNDFDKMQAAWVALREVSHLETVDIQEKLVSIEIALEKYKQLRLNQMLLKADTDEKVQLEEGENITFSETYLENGRLN